MNETAQSVSSTSPSEARSHGGAATSDMREASFSRSLRNILWMSSSGLVTRVLNLARGIILARLLTPFDFGVYGLAGSIVGIKERIADIGAGTFLVYRPKEISEHADTTFWVNVVLSSAMLALLAAVAPLLARFYRQPLLMPVLVLMGLAAWARINASIHQSLLRTKSRFRALAIIDNCSSAAWLVIAVVLAWKGFGVWALVTSAVVANVILATLLIATQGWRPRWHLSRHSLRQLGGFSFWFLGQGLAWYLFTNVDNLLIGRFLGMALLGIYALAFNYALLPVTVVGNAIGNVAFAELPKVYDRPEVFWSTYVDFSRVSALLGSGVAFAALVAAPTVFPLIFGHKWDASIMPFQVLSVYAAVRCLWLDPFLAWGKFRLSCLTGFASVVAAAVLIGLSTKFGLVGIACAMLILQMAFNVTALWVTARSWRPLFDTARATLPYLAGGVAASIAALAFRHFVLSGRIELSLANGALTIVLFLCLYGLLFRAGLSNVVRQLRNRQAPGVSG
jgi:O-antigen/teichoic acid export membrane protein